MLHIYWLHLYFLFLERHQLDLPLYNIFNKMLQSFVLPNLAFVFHSYLKYFHKCTCRNLKNGSIFWNKWKLLKYSFFWYTAVKQNHSSASLKEKGMKKIKINIIKNFAIVETKPHNVRTSYRRELFAKITTNIGLALGYQSQYKCEVITKILLLFLWALDII